MICDDPFFGWENYMYMIFPGYDISDVSFISNYLQGISSFSIRLVGSILSFQRGVAPCEDKHPFLELAT